MEGQYVDTHGQAHQCVGIIENSAVVGGQAVAVHADSECPFTCKPGYVKDDGNRACSPPIKGKYSNASGVATDCDAVQGDAGGFQDFKENAGGNPVETARGCDFTCNAGYKKDKTAWTCTYPAPGKYADANRDEQDCSEITNSAWAENTQAVSGRTDCAFTCTGGAVLNVGSGTCDLPSAGIWYNGGYNGGATSPTRCTAIPNQKDWVAPLTPLTSDTCDFNCLAGYRKVNRTCVPPTAGTYVQADNSEAGCRDIPNKQSWGGRACRLTHKL